MTHTLSLKNGKNRRRKSVWLIFCKRERNPLIWMLSLWHSLGLPVPQQMAVWSGCLILRIIKPAWTVCRIRLGVRGLVAKLGSRWHSQYFRWQYHLVGPPHSGGAWIMFYTLLDYGGWVGCEIPVLGESYLHGQHAPGGYRCCLGSPAALCCEEVWAVQLDMV